MMIGEPMMTYWDAEDELHNRVLLLKRVNEPDAFDVDLKPKAKDRLQISICCGHRYMDYGFVYKGGERVEEEFDGIEWMWRHEEVEFGKVAGALKKM